jgi:hypothetical protein
MATNETEPCRLQHPSASSFKSDAVLLLQQRLQETSNTTCFKALRDTLVGYKWEYLVYVVMLGAYSFAMWNFNIGLYRSWAVMSFTCGHILGPILLNPAIMSLAY